MWLKEGVCAILAFAIIGWTLVLLRPPLSGPTYDVEAAQGIFSILGGWGGVILGYYFGRLPAERVAERAEEKAEEAIKTKQKELSDSAVRVNGQQEKFRKFLEQIDGLITSLP
jgi:hypothetical protein